MTIEIMQVKQLREKERPRERAIEKGVDQLQNRELLALLLRSGTVGKSALELADEILSEYSLNELSNCSMKQLNKFKGCGKAKALELLACFELCRRILREQLISRKEYTTLSEIGLWLQKEIGGKHKEHFMAVYLDSANHLISSKTIAIGGLNQAQIFPRDIFMEALNCHAAKIIVAHNHPSQNLTISKEDLEFTFKLVQDGRIMQIPILDHLIVSSNCMISILTSDEYERFLLDS